MQRLFKAKQSSFLFSFLCLPTLLLSAEIPIFGKVYRSFKGIVQNPYLLLTIGLVLAAFLVYFIWKNMWLRAAVVIAIGAVIAEFVGVSEWIVGNPTTSQTTSQPSSTNEKKP